MNVHAEDDLVEMIGEVHGAVIVGFGECFGVNVDKVVLADDEGGDTQAVLELTSDQSNLLRYRLDSVRQLLNRQEVERFFEVVRTVRHTLQPHNQ